MASLRGGGRLLCLALAGCALVRHGHAQALRGEDAETRQSSEARHGRALAERSACPFLGAEAASGVVQRWFDFEGERQAALRGYRLRYAPFVHTRATYRPFAHARCDLPAKLGVHAGYEQALGIESTLGGVPLDTTAFAYEVAVELELELGRFAVTPRAGFAYRHFELEGGFVPDAEYDMLAMGLDGSFRLDWFLAELGWRAHVVLDAGPLESAEWFPHAGGFGHRARLLAGGSPTSWLDAFALAELEAYSFSLHPDRPGTYPLGRADSSYDRYLRLGVGVRFIVPER